MSRTYFWCSQAEEEEHEYALSKHHGRINVSQHRNIQADRQYRDDKNTDKNETQGGRGVQVSPATNKKMR